MENTKLPSFHSESLFGSKKPLKPILRQRKSGDSSSKSSGSNRSRVGFDETNLLMTQNDHTYGFLKADRASTPYPRKQQNLDAEMLSARIKAVAQEQSQKTSISDGPLLNDAASSDDSDDKQNRIKIMTRDNNKSIVSIGYTIRTSESNAGNSEVLSFAERRRRFDEGEFTITRGIKMSDLPQHGQGLRTTHTFNHHHRTRDVERDSTFSQFEKIQDFCRSENVAQVKPYTL